MGKAGVGLIKGIDVEEIVDTLDSYYCYNLVVMHFSHALRNRLEGQAAFLSPRRRARGERRARQKGREEACG